MVFVSVKPGVVPSVLQDVKSVASNKLFISVAMGVSVSQLENVSLHYMERFQDRCLFHSIRFDVGPYPALTK